MRWKVLISAPYMQPVPEKYRKLLEENGVEIVLPPVKERLSEAELLEYVNDIDGVISGDDEFTERVFEAAKNLKVISKWGTGIDSIDLRAAKARGVSIRNTPGAFTVPVADSVMGYILCFARKLTWMHEEMREGSWKKRPGVALSESTLGVIGVGNIGKAVVKRAAAFGMRLIGNDIIDIPVPFLESTGLTMVPKEDLLREADFVSLNCDLNPTSYHIIGREELKLMKPAAYLINTARGQLIDEVELIRALREGSIAGAALDVFEVEPLPAESPLRGFKNVMLAPHNSNSSPAAWERVHENTVKNLLEEIQKREK
ncbi:MAG: phosphoglycerate dehydrogenase [Planctomycetota bacterium]